MSDRDPPNPFLLLRRGERLGGADGDPNDPLDVFVARGVLTVGLANQGRSYRVLHRAWYGSHASPSPSLEYMIPSGVSKLGEAVDDAEHVREELAWREAVLRSAGRAIEAAVRAACLDMRLPAVPEGVRIGLAAVEEAGRKRKRLTSTANVENNALPADGRGAPADRPPRYPRPNNAAPPARLEGEPGTVAFVDGRFVDLAAVTPAED